MNITREEHRRILYELAEKACPEVLAKHEGREATPHLLSVIQQEVCDFVIANTDLAFVLTVSLTAAGLVIIGIEPPEEPVDPIEDAPLTSIKVQRTLH